jgi:hypothetical protein
MYKSTLVKSALIASVIMSANSYAFEVLKQPATSNATITKPGIAGRTGNTKQVTLMSIKLSAKEQRSIFQNLTKNVNRAKITNDELPSSISLGMNNVPVLNQGKHGTCVTFASTAAIDAFLGKGDYVSQLCNLELGNYFETNGYLPSGWDGAFGPLILDQMLRFGYVNMTNQNEKTCAGVSEYPLNDKDNKGRPMTLDQFKQLSENYVNDKGEVQWIWMPLMNVFDRFSQGFENVEDAERTLLKIKQSLVEGNRVTFGTLIVSSQDCNNVACASYHAQNDTWALIDSIKNDPQLIGGHEMVITGYDDNAVATDKNGKKYQGLLTLRNSWSDEVGDKGNYYMTYEYFITLSMEAQKIASN